MGTGGRLMTLEELIARQRFMLNRTTQATRLPAGAERPKAETGKQWAEFEKASAEGTRALAEALEKLCGRPFPMLFDAEKEMLAAAEVLPVCKFDEAVPHDKDALTNLVKARDTVRQALTKPQPSSAEMRQFDRAQFQKLRRPQEQDEKKEAEQLADRLRQLAKQEEFVYATIAQQCDEQAKPSKAPASSPGPGQPTKPSRESKEQPAGGDSEDLQKRQMEIVREATAVEQALARIARGGGSRDFSELAQKRMNAAVQKAEDVSGALDRGNKPEAAGTSREAAGLFAELAVHVEGLLAREAAQQVAAARDLAAQLAQRENDLADRLGEGPQPKGTSGTSSTGTQKNRAQTSKGGQAAKPSSGSASGAPAPGSNGKEKAKGPGGPGGLGSEKGRGEGVGEPDPPEQAARLAEAGRTLEDLLKALGRSGERTTPEAIAQIEKLLREGEVAATVQRMGQLVATLRSARWPEGRTETREIADRLEILAQRLDGLHRTMIAPRVQALIELEKRAAALRQSLTRLESQVAIADWHRQTDVFLQELAKGLPSSAAAVRLQEAMRAEGWGGSLRLWDRNPTSPYYIGPGVYDVALAAIAVQLQQEVREMILKDLVSGTDEATPPEYRELVERYFQVLSQRSSRGSQILNPKP
jgi:hypothetical protein